MTGYRDPKSYRDPTPYRGIIPATIIDSYQPDYKLQIVNRYGSEVCDMSGVTLNYVEWVLNDSGSADYTVSQEDDRVKQPLLMENELQVWIDGNVKWQGFHGDVNNNVDTATFSSEGLLSYFLGRFVREDIDFNTDQRQIAADLIDYAQSGPDQDLNIVQATFDPPGTTVARIRHYLADERGNIYDLVRAFTNLIDGFDIDIVVFNDGRREFTPYYPMKGSFRQNYALEYGKNITEYTVKESAWPGTFGNLADVTGTPNAEQDKLIGTFRDDASCTKYGEFQIVHSDGTQDSTQGWLDGIAEQIVQDRKEPVIVTELESVNVPVKLLGVLQTGDIVPVKIQKGRVSINQNYRIMKIRWEPDKNTLKLVFN